MLTGLWQGHITLHLCTLCWPRCPSPVYIICRLHPFLSALLAVICGRSALGQTTVQFGRSWTFLGHICPQTLLRQHSAQATLLKVGCTSPYVNASQESFTCQSSAQITISQVGCSPLHVSASGESHTPALSTSHTLAIKKTAHHCV